MEQRFHMPNETFQPVNSGATHPFYAPSPPPPAGGQTRNTIPFPPYAHEMAQAPPHAAKMPQAAEEKGKFDAASLFSMPGKIRNSLQEKFPDSIDLSDILLVILLLYLFLESDDDDMLIILGVLAFSWIWPLLKKDKEE